jgi:Zn-dependent oligopeptidase
MLREQLRNATSPSTRQRADAAYDSRLAVNVPVVARALALRREIASLLGYASWADYVTEEKMIKSAANANAVG